MRRICSCIAGCVRVRPYICPIVIVLSCVVASTTYATTFIVNNTHPLASDTNPGTSEEPLRTIRQGIVLASTGDTVLVKAGVYLGGISLSKPIKVIGESGATLRPFSDGQGVGVFISSDNCTIQGFRIENFSMAISAFQSPRANVKVLNNHTYKSEYSCWIDGTNWLIEGNEFERAYWWSGVGDCDYTRMFGRGHVFRGNYIHGTNIPYDIEPLFGNDYAHLDAIQYFGNSSNGEVFQDIRIERNFVTDIVQGFYISNPDSPGDINNVTITDNVIWGQYNPPAGQLANRPVWGILFGSGNGFYPAQNVTIRHNLIYNVLTCWAGTGGFDGNIERNIFANPAGFSTAYYTGGGSTFNIGGTGDWLFNVYDSGEYWNDNNIVSDPDMRSTSSPLGPDGIPLTQDDGWIPMKSLAQAYGPRVVLDTDQDLLSDDDEINIYGTDPNVMDTDGDGVIDGIEVQLGTDPLDPFDFPLLSLMSSIGRTLVFSILLALACVAIYRGTGALNARRSTRR